MNHKSRKFGITAIRGQALTEYIILLLLVAVISIVAVGSLGRTIKSKIQTARRHINEQVSLDVSDD